MGETCLNLIMGKKAESSYDEESYDGGYNGGCDGAENTWFRSWGNDCCVGWHRIVLIVLSALFLVAAIYQSSHTGNLIDRSINAGAFSTNGQSTSEREDLVKVSNDTNDYTGPFLLWSELGAVLALGAGLAGLWHVLKWNVASRHMANISMFIAVAVECIAVGFFVLQMQNDKARDEGSLDPAVAGSGAAAIIVSVTGLFLMVFMQFFASDFMSAVGQTNCCDNMGCAGENDCGFCSMCGCSGGRIVTWIVSGVTMAVAIARVVNLGNLRDDQFHPNSPDITINKVGLPFINAFELAMVMSLAYPTIALLHGFIWNENSQTAAVVVGLVVIVNEFWSFGYAASFLAEGDATIYNSNGDKLGTKPNEDRFVAIASLGIVSLVLTALTWFVTWFFSDEFRRHDISDDSDEEEEPECCETMCYWATRTTARLIILVLVVIGFAIYVAEIGVASQLQVDRSFENSGAGPWSLSSTDKNTGNKVSIYLLNHATYAAPVGALLCLMGLMHVWFWNRVTATATAAGFIFAFFGDLITAAYGYKQTYYQDEYKTKFQLKDVDSKFVSLEAFATIAFVVSAAISITSVFFSCGFNKADRGEKRAGWEARSSDEEDEYTYATADSYDE